MLHTITNYSHLLKIITLINVDHFESLLTTHPNQELTQSMCHGLHHGCWPYANMDDPKHPSMYDNSSRTLRDPLHKVFVREQRDKEVRLGRFSDVFGPDLLPGMYVIPIGVVLKPHSTDLHLVVDHSAKLYSLNSMIPREAGSVKLDNLHDLGQCILEA